MRWDFFMKIDGYLKDFRPFPNYDEDMPNDISYKQANLLKCYPFELTIYNWGQLDINIKS